MAEGLIVKGRQDMSAEERVAVAPIKVRSVMTKSNLPIAGYSVNPYVGCTHGCKYCYACFMKRFTGPRRYAGCTVIVGSVTDPYLPQEEEYRRTRAFLEEMKGSGINLIIVTKSDLVLRDLDLIASYPSPLICWSMNTLDEDFRKDMDGAVAIERRIAAMKKCHEQGLRTTCFVSPIFPGITDVFAIIDRIKGFCNYIWLENLNLRGNFKAGIMEYIKEKHPGLLPLYRDIYDRRDRTYWHMLDENVREYAQREGMLYVIDKEPFMRSADGSPVIINYFYHSEIKQSAKKK